MGNRLSIYKLNVGSCNGCDIEILVSNLPDFELENFGLRIVTDPSEAQLLIVTGPVTMALRDELRRAYEAIKEPRRVIAMGSCAISGGIFGKSYTVVGPVDQIVPVYYYVLGCPPSPSEIVKILTGIEAGKIKSSVMPKWIRGSPKFDRERCDGCGACVQICPTGAIESVKENDRLVMKICYERCTLCSWCQEICPEEAIQATGKEFIFFDRATASASFGVELFKCNKCGSPFTSSRHIKNISHRIEKSLEKHRAFDTKIEDSIEICPSCKKVPAVIKEEKRLLVRLTRQVQSG